MIMYDHFIQSLLHSLALASVVGLAAGTAMALILSYLAKPENADKPETKENSDESNN
jgi:hypothetical protein